MDNSNSNSTQEPNDKPQVYFWRVTETETILGPGRSVSVGIKHCLRMPAEEITMIMVLNEQIVATLDPNRPPKDFNSAIPCRWNFETRSLDVQYTAWERQNRPAEAVKINIV